MKSVFVLCAVFLITLCVSAQDAPDAIFKTIQDSGQVVIRQSKDIENAVVSSIARNNYRKNKGYRVRIFFDNKKDARQQSEDMAVGFAELYPHIPVYREFSDLYFKVAVGDFRTKSDAIRFLEAIRKTYPPAFVIVENVNLVLLPKTEEPTETKEEEVNEAGML